MAMKMRTITAGLFVVVVLEIMAGCRAYSIRRQHEQDEQDVGIDKFYFPSDEALLEFQQILVRELGLSRIPDVSKVFPRGHLIIFSPAFVTVLVGSVRNEIQRLFSLLFFLRQSMFLLIR